MKFDIRTATAADAVTAVPLVYSSGPAAFDYVFVTRNHDSAQEFLLYAFRHRGGEFGYGNHTVATHAGQVIGVGACFSARDAVAFTASTAVQLLMFYGIIEGLLVIRRGLQMARTLALPHRTKNYVGHVGVAPDWQGQGIGRLLLEHFLQVSRQQQQTHVVLDVSLENPRAQKLYERIGFQTVKTCPGTLHDVPGHYRMEIVL